MTQNTPSKTTDNGDSTTQKTAEHILPPPSHIKPKNSFISLSFIAFVLLPTALAGFYLFFIASDIYVSESRFAVKVEQGSIPALTEGFSQMLAPSTGSDDSHIVKSYIESPALVQKLVQNHNLKSILADQRAPFYMRIEPSDSIETVSGQFSQLVKLKYDTMSDILTMTARGFEPQQAQTLAEAILQETESFVNTSSKRIQEDSVAFAQEKAAEAEQTLLSINKELMNFRNANENFDPSQEATGVVGIMQNLEVELAKAQAERKAALEFFKPNSPKVQSMTAQIRALQNQISDLNTQIATKEGAPLSQLLEDYETLKAKQEFAMQRYQTTLVTLETAQLDAQKKQKYLIRIVEPTLPQDAIEPLRLYGTFTVFVVLLFAYGIIRMIIDALRDSMT